MRKLIIAITLAVLSLGVVASNPVITSEQEAELSQLMFMAGACRYAEAVHPDGLSKGFKARCYTNDRKVDKFRKYTIPDVVKERLYGYFDKGAAWMKEWFNCQKMNCKEV